MSLIPSFPDQLLDLHHHWHSPSSHPGLGPGRVHAAGTPGGGLEFFQFHRDFVASFHAWYDAQAFANPAAVAPWHEIPAELKVAGAGWTQGWANDETRIKTNKPAFNSADELGTFIELGIHDNFIHGAAATVYNEPVVGTFHSPLSTYFYQIHGLVDYWLSQWGTIQRPPSRPGPFDHCALVKRVIRADKQKYTQLLRRSRTTTDPAQKAELDREIDELGSELDVLYDEFQIRDCPGNPG